MEKISFISAAQRRGCSVEEIKQLVKDKKLKEVSPGKVDKEALLALSGISPTGNQTKKSASKKPNVMTFEATAAYLNTDIAGVKELIEEGVLEVAEGVGGVKGPKEAQVKMYKKKLEGREASAKKKDEEAMKPRNSTKDKKGRNEEDETIPLLDEEKGEEAPKPFDLDETMKKLFEGVQLLPKEVREAALGKCKKCEVKYNAHDLKEVADVAYKMGKLAVYESMSEFKRKVKA